LKSQEWGVQSNCGHLGLLHFKADSTINGLMKMKDKYLQWEMIRKLQLYAVYSFKHGKTFNRTSWIPLEHWFIVDLKYLKPLDYNYEASILDYQLDKDSCEILMQEVKKRHFPWKNTNDQWLKTMQHIYALRPRLCHCSHHFAAALDAKVEKKSTGLKTTVPTQQNCKAYILKIQHLYRLPGIKMEQMMK
jgi:hypothetical protein